MPRIELENVLALLNNPYLLDYSVTYASYVQCIACIVVK
jgi:hypothetical protein